MKITRMGEYAVLGLIYMSNQDRRIVLAKEVADSLGLPQQFVAKIFQMLAKRGILTSHKGKGGGFSLGASPEEITLRQIIETIQGPPLLMWCAAEEAECSRYQRCSLEEVVKTAQRQLDDYFQKITLKELASGIKF